MSLIGELKRRNVIRVTGAYIVLSWLLLQIADVIFDFMDMPAWSGKLLIIFLAVGLVLTVVFSWVYELTPEGIKREKNVDRSRSITYHTARKLDAVTIVLVLAAIGVVVLDRYVLDSASPAATAHVAQPSETDPVSPAARAADMDERPSIAVLPFVNMSQDAGNEYFSDGISEELLNVLVKVNGLRVPSRTSSFRYKGSDLTLAAIGRELGVDHVLEGSVRKAGMQVRVTAQLIDVHSDSHLWSETYTRTLDDIFLIQDEIAAAIVTALRVKLGAAETVATGGTQNVQAYNHYLKGRFFWHQRKAQAFVAAEQELIAATGLDPAYADAWAGLADVYVLQPEYGWATMAEAVPKARAAVERALALDPDSAQALTTRAYLLYLFDWQWTAAEADFRRAIELEPGYATAHQWYAEMLMALRRFDEAEARARRAVELDPLAQVHPMVLGNILLHAGRSDEAIRWYEQSLRLAPEWPNAMGNLAHALIWSGRHEEARAILLQTAAINGLEEQQFEHVLVTLDALAGKIPRQQAVDVVIRSPHAACDPHDKPYWLALLGAHEQSLAVLERCLAEDEPYASFINAVIGYQSMRNMPRFQALLAKMNLPVDEAP